MDIDYVKFVESAHHVKRWAGTHIIGHRRSISEHTYEVTMYAREFAEALPVYDTDLTKDSRKLQVLEWALFHDLSEVVTNDVSYVAKRDFPSLKVILDQIDGEVLKHFSVFEANFSKEAQFIVKLADTLAVYNEITEEHRFGTIKGNFNTIEILNSLFNKNHSWLGSTSEEFLSKLFDLMSKYFGDSIVYDVFHPRFSKEDDE